MGMFDRVWAECLECHAEIEIQTKGGICKLEDFKLAAVPAEIAVYIEEDIIYCGECSTKYQLKCHTLPPAVPMYIVKI